MHRHKHKSKLLLKRVGNFGKSSVGCVELYVIVLIHLSFLSSTFGNIYQELFILHFWKGPATSPGTIIVQLSIHRLVYLTYLKCLLEPKIQSFLNALGSLFSDLSLISLAFLEWSFIISCHIEILIHTNLDTSCQ